jgi:hypothetical protein
MIPPFQELMSLILEKYGARDPQSIANREFMETLAFPSYRSRPKRNARWWKNSRDLRTASIGPSCTFVARDSSNQRGAV